MFIGKLMDMRREGNNICFHILLNYWEALEMEMSLKECNTSMYNIVWKFHDPMGFVCRYFEI